MFLPRDSFSKMSKDGAVKVDVNITPEVEAQQDEEPTMKDLMVMMQIQLQEQKKDRELMKQLVQQQSAIEKDSVDPAPSVKRRMTMYLPNTPHRVNERTSMGGMSNMDNGENEAGEDDSDILYGDGKAEEQEGALNLKTSSMNGSCDIVHILMISVMQIYIYSDGRIGKLYLTGCVVATFNINDN